MLEINNQDFQTLTGLTREEFHFFEEQVRPLLERNYLGEEKDTGRKRVLQISDMFLMAVIFLRQYPTHLLLSVIFRVSQSTVSRTLGFVVDSLHDYFRGTIHIPSRPVRDSISTFFRNQRITMVLDGTEQRIAKCSVRDIEEAFYSGKKRSHTLTKLIAVSPSGYLLFISKSYAGSLNDLNVVQMPENQIFNLLEPDEGVMADGGYKGLYRLHPNTFIPFSKAAGHPDLTPEEKKFNNELSSIRVIVENVIGHVKMWKCCSLPFRYDNIIEFDALRSYHHKIWYVCASFTHLTVLPLK